MKESLPIARVTLSKDTMNWLNYVTENTGLKASSLIQILIRAEKLEPRSIGKLLDRPYKEEEN